MADNNNKQVPCAKKKWSERDTIRFLELYEAEEVLWNVRLKEYKNKDARNAAVQRLIRNFDFDITVDDVNKKINNIRSTYLQEKAKIKKSMRTGSGAHEIYVPTLPWYETAERFLGDIVKCRKSFKNIESDTDQDESSPDIPPSPPISPSSSKDVFVKPKTKKRNIENIENSIQKLESIKDQVLYKESEDEFSYFGKNIASQLRQLPIMDALDLESEILELVKRKRKSFLERENPSANTDDSSYTIEIPEHVLNGVWSQNDETCVVMEESQSVLIPQAQTPQRDDTLDQAVKSIGGFDLGTEEQRGADLRFI